ncbi:MAG: malonic semialdehyde reductase [Pseudomonadota bacterium]
MNTPTLTDEDRDALAREDVRAVRGRIARADADTLALLLTEARTHYGWQDREVPEALLRELYDIAKMGPTSMNQQPMRLVFVRSAAAKDRLEPLLLEQNRQKMRTAPVTAIVGHDLAFYEKLPQVFPANPKAKGLFEGDAAMAQANAFRNGTLQGAWMMLAARALGLDVGAMSGFDNAGVDGEFFAGTTVKSNFLMNLGYADETKIFRRLPRLAFDEVATII